MVRSPVWVVVQESQCWPRDSLESSLSAESEYCKLIQDPSMQSTTVAFFYRYGA